MNAARHLRVEAVMGVEFAGQLAPRDGGGQPRPDPETVARDTTERDIQVVGLGELVLVEEERAAPHLAKDEVEPAVVAEIPGDHRAAVAIAIRARQVTDVEKRLALDIEERTLALERR